MEPENTILSEVTQTQKDKRIRLSSTSVIYLRRNELIMLTEFTNFLLFLHFQGDNLKENKWLRFVVHTYNTSTKSVRRIAISRLTLINK
ncbi:hypothetical protein STEG23_032326, partial [Scotinomys teguina]